MYRIGMILDQPFPTDIRVDKEAKALLSAGFEVELLCVSNGKLPDREQRPDRLQIYRTAIKRDYVTRSFESITLFQRAWVKPLERFIAESKPDILHVHDFTILKTVMHVAKSAKIPVVADLHENMPSTLIVQRGFRRFYLLPLDVLVRNYYWWRWNEKVLLQRAAHVIVVVPEAKERLLKYSLPAEKITVVSNTENEYTFGVGRSDPEVLSNYGDKWVASYVGSIGPHRGVDTVIKAIPHVVRQIPNFRFLIIGVKKDDSYILQLKELVKKLKVEPWVEFIGWQPFDKVNTFVELSATCLVPHNDFEHTQTTIPHKLFQYMLVGKPVVVSDVRPLKRVVEETNSGLIFKANDPLSLAQRFIELHQNPSLGEMLGKNGYAAARGMYSWDHDAQRLVDAYRKIEASHAST